MIDYSVEILFTSTGFKFDVDNLTQTSYTQNTLISSGETYECKVKPGILKALANTRQLYKSLQLQYHLHLKIYLEMMS